MYLSFYTIYHFKDNCIKWSTIMIIIMLYKVLLINHQNGKHCCMFCFDSTLVIMYVPSWILCYVYCNWVSLVFIRWPWRDVAGVSISHLLPILQPTSHLLQQKNTKTNWAPVASSIFYGGNYFRKLFKRGLLSINSITHKLIQPVIYLTQNIMSLYFSNNYSTDKIQRRMTVDSLPYLYQWLT